MGCWPVMMRELRAETRRSASYWLRLAGAAVLMVLVYFVAADSKQPTYILGPQLFITLQMALCLAIVVVGPMLTADCVSREAREGTLGLLFLTPLTAEGIVVAKSLVQALRALSLVLAALPVLYLPFLLGGLTWRVAALSALMNWSGISLAVAAGVLASVLAVRRARAVILAIIFSACLFSFSCVVFGWIYEQIVMPKFVSSYGPIGWTDRWEVGVSCYTGMCYIGLFARSSIPVGPVSPQTIWAWLSVAGGIVLFSLLTLWLVVRLAAWQLKRGLARPAVLTRRSLWYRLFCTPILWRRTFHRSMRRRLDRNPVVWLQQFTWTARLSDWGWCLAMLLSGVIFVILQDAGIFNLAYVLLPGPFRQGGLLRGGGTVMALVLVMGGAMSAVNSLRQEWQNGFMELLLISPLSIGSIISGRIGTVCRRFVPSLVALFIVWSFIWMIDSPLANPWSMLPLSASLLVSVATLLVTFLTVVMLGFYFSMKRWPVLLSWLATLGLGLGGPLFCGIWLGAGAWPAFSLQILIMIGAWFLVYHSLRWRTFVVNS